MITSAGNDEEIQHIRMINVEWKLKRTNRNVCQWGKSDENINIWAKNEEIGKIYTSKYVDRIHRQL